MMASNRLQENMPDKSRDVSVRAVFRRFLARKRGLLFAPLIVGSVTFLTPPFAASSTGAIASRAIDAIFADVLAAVGTTAFRAALSADDLIMLRHDPANGQSRPQIGRAGDHR